jgi:hypothetical protein
LEEEKIKIERNKHNMADEIKTFKVRLDPLNRI